MFLYLPLLTIIFSLSVQIFVPFLLSEHLIFKPALSPNVNLPWFQSEFIDYGVSTVLFAVAICAAYHYVIRVALGNQAAFRSKVSGLPGEFPGGVISLVVLSALVLEFLYVLGKVPNHQFIKMFGLFGVGYIIALSYSSTGHWIFKGAALVTISLVVYMNLVSGYVSQSVYIIWTVFLIAVFHRPHKRKKIFFIFIFPVAVTIILLTLNTFNRNSHLYLPSNSSSHAFETYMSEYAEYMRNKPRVACDVSLVLCVAMGKISDRVSKYMEAYAIVNREGPRPLFSDYTVYSDIAVNLVPRWVWPSRPSFDRANEYGREYGHLAQNDRITSVNLSASIEAFAAFGRAGSFIPGILIGLVMACCMVLMQMSIMNPTIRSGGAFLIAQSGWAIESGTRAVIVSAIYATILLCLISAVFFGVLRVKRLFERRGTRPMQR